MHYGCNKKKIVPALDDVVEKRLKGQSLISNTLVATVAESIQDVIKADTINVTKLVKKVGNLLQEDHHETIRIVSSILAKGKELASFLTKIEDSTTQILILMVLLGVIAFLGLINLYTIRYA